MTTGFWHVSNGQLYDNGLVMSEADYKARLRKAYGSLRGVKIIRSTDEQCAYKLAFFGMGATAYQHMIDGKMVGFSNIVNP